MQRPALLLLLPTLLLAQSTSPPLVTFTAPPPSLPLDLSAPIITVAWTIAPSSPLVDLGLSADLWFLPERDHTSTNSTPPEFEYPVAQHIAAGAGAFAFPFDPKDFKEKVGKNATVGGEGRRYIFELRFDLKGEGVLVPPTGTIESGGFEVKGVKSGGVVGRGVGLGGVVVLVGVLGAVVVL